MSKPRYDESAIQIMKGFEGIRHRPTREIGAIDIKGQAHQFKEVIDNAIDEMTIKGLGGRIDIWLFRNKERSKYQLAVRDNGRGVPLGKMVDVFTEIGASGKFSSSDNAYKTSAGLFGRGAKVAAALSHRFKVVTYREDGTGAMLLNPRTHSNKPVWSELNLSASYPEDQTGTTIIYEPDELIFKNQLALFAENGYEEIISLLQRFNLFMRDTEIKFYNVDHLLPEEFWDMKDIQENQEFLDKFRDTIIFESDPNMDIFKYIKTVFNVEGTLAWSKEDITHVMGPKEKMGYDIKLFVVRNLKSHGVMSFVNNVPIRDNSSSHIAGVNLVIKTFLAEFIQDSAIKGFFLTNYRLPLLAAMSIQYAGAEFSGTTKDAFRDQVFYDLFTEHLTAHLAAQKNDEQWQALYEILASDIEMRYAQLYSKPLKNVALQKLTLSLNYPDNYSPCQSTDKTVNELFLVEGKSAAGSKYFREGNNQAMYALRGKVPNLVRKSGDALTLLRRNKIYQDLVTLIGIRPGTSDLSSMNFNKIFTMTDADPDGGHIQCLVISTLYTISAELINQGKVCLCTPPLYDIAIHGVTRKDKTKVFLKNEEALTDTRINYVYRETLEVRILGADGKYYTLEGSTFREFCYLTIRIGEMITDLARQLAVDVRILERLIIALPYIHPDRPDLDRIREILSADRVKYDLESIIVSIGSNDMVIPLKELNSAIYEKVLPTLQQAQWRKYNIEVRSLKTDFFKDFTRLTFVELYLIFENLNSIFDVRRYKGIGKMGGDEVSVACMNPKTRAYYQITDIGDVQRIFDLLGVEVDARKEVLLQKGLL